jgi:hypothetical protein
MIELRFNLIPVMQLDLEDGIVTEDEVNLCRRE